MFDFIIFDCLEEVLHNLMNKYKIILRIDVDTL